MKELARLDVDLDADYRKGLMEVTFYGRKKEINELLKKLSSSSSKC